MTPPPALAPATSFFTALDSLDHDEPLPSFVGLGLRAHATDAELGALADRAEAGVCALQLIFSAQTAGALALPAGLAAQLQLLLDRATGQVTELPSARGARLALMA